jgi:hypothetical protein
MQVRVNMAEIVHNNTHKVCNLTDVTTTVKSITSNCKNLLKHLDFFHQRSPLFQIHRTIYTVYLVSRVSTDK